MNKIVTLMILCIFLLGCPNDPTSQLVLGGRKRTNRGEIHWERDGKFLVATIDNRKIRTDVWNIWGYDQKTETWILLERANARSYDFGRAALAYVEKQEREIENKQAEDYWSRN